MSLPSSLATRGQWQKSAIRVIRLEHRHGSNGSYADAFEPAPTGGTYGENGVYEFGEHKEEGIINEENDDAPLLDEASSPIGRLLRLVFLITAALVFVAIAVTAIRMKWGAR